MMCASFNGNPCTTIFWYSPTNARNKMDKITINNEPSSLVRYIPKHNVLIVGGDVNAQIGKDGNNKFCLHNMPNRNSEHPADLKNWRACLTLYCKKGGETLGLNHS